MRLSMRLGYGEGFPDVAQRVVKLEEAGLDVVWVAEAYGYDAVSRLGYLAALTSVELVTGIVIVPQRQTVLVAKQAAEVDVLTGGHLRLGVGIGWNAVEYEALGQSFSNRGRRSEEQVTLMRRLWTEPSVTFTGRYERDEAFPSARLKMFKRFYNPAHFISLRI